MTLPEVRARVAERYPETLTDTLGRVHSCIPREAVLRGDHDDGEAIRGLMRVLEGVE